MTFKSRLVYPISVYMYIAAFSFLPGSGAIKQLLTGEVQTFELSHTISLCMYTIGIVLITQLLMTKIEISRSSIVVRSLLRTREFALDDSVEVYLLDRPSFRHGHNTKTAFRRYLRIENESSKVSIPIGEIVNYDELVQWRKGHFDEDIPLETIEPSKLAKAFDLFF